MDVRWEDEMLELILLVIVSRKFTAFEMGSC